MEIYGKNQFLKHQNTLLQIFFGSVVSFNWNLFNEIGETRLISFEAWNRGKILLLHWLKNKNRKKQEKNEKFKYWHTNFCSVLFWGGQKKFFLFGEQRNWAAGDNGEVFFCFVCLNLSYRDKAFCREVKKPINKAKENSLRHLSRVRYFFSVIKVRICELFQIFSPPKKLSQKN